LFELLIGKDSHLLTTSFLSRFSQFVPFHPICFSPRRQDAKVFSLRLRGFA
jgi:hypothetical protein